MNKKTVSVCLNEDLAEKFNAYMVKNGLNQSEALRGFATKCLEDEGKEATGKEFDELLEEIKKAVTKEDAKPPVTVPVIKPKDTPDDSVSREEMKQMESRFMAALEDMKPKEPEEPILVMGELDVNTPVSEFGGLEKLVSKRTAIILNAILFYTIDDYSPLFDVYPDKIDYDVYNLLLKSIEEYENDDFNSAESSYDLADSYAIDGSIVNDAIVILDQLVIDSINQVYSNGAVPTKDLINQMKERATYLMREAFDEETAVSISFEPDNYVLVQKWLDAQNKSNKTDYDLETWLRKQIGESMVKYGSKGFPSAKHPELVEFGEKLMGPGKA